MFQDLDGIRYENAFQEVTPAPEDLLLLYDKDGVLCREEAALGFPRVSDCFPEGISGDCPGLRYAFTLGGERYFLGDAAELERQLARAAACGRPMTAPTGGGACGGQIARATDGRVAAYDRLRGWAAYDRPYGGRAAYDRPYGGRAAYDRTGGGRQMTAVTGDSVGRGG